MTEVLSRRSGVFNKRAAQRHTKICLLSSVFCLLMSVFCPLYAEELPDPTRPPAFLIGIGTGSGDGAGSVPGQWLSGMPSSGLQSTIISESRRAAIIDGKTVELGEKHGNAQLIEVNEGSVVLRNAQTRRVLTLFPDVKMMQREMKTKKASSEGGVQPDETSTMPAAQYEKLLSGHPKEKK